MEDLAVGTMLWKGKVKQPFDTLADWKSQDVQQMKAELRAAQWIYNYFDLICF